MSFIHIRLLSKRLWFENRKAWSIGVMAIAALLSFLFLLTWHWRTSFNGDTTKGIFLLMLFGGGGIFISAILKDLGDKQRGIWFLILPAPVSAKLAVALFYGTIAYLFAYFGIFYGIRGIILLLLGEEIQQLLAFDLFKNGFYRVLFMFADFQLIILLGSVYFNKSQLLKTLLTMIAGFFAVFNVNALILQAITHERAITSTIPLDSFQFVYHGENIYVISPDGIQLAMSVLLWVVVPLALGFITWLRIKEKEL